MSHTTLNTLTLTTRQLTLYTTNTLSLLHRLWDGIRESYLQLFNDAGEEGNFEEQTSPYHPRQQFLHHSHTSSNTCETEHSVVATAQEATEHVRYSSTTTGQQQQVKTRQSGDSEHTEQAAGPVLQTASPHVEEQRTGYHHHLINVAAVFLTYCFTALVSFLQRLAISAKSLLVAKTTREEKTTTSAAPSADNTENDHLQNLLGVIFCAFGEFTFSSFLKFLERKCVLLSGVFTNILK